MSLVDRFICRREGHKPTGTIGGTGTKYVSTYICACARCGKLAEFTPDGKPLDAPHASE